MESRIRLCLLHGGCSVRKRLHIAANVCVDFERMWVREHVKVREVRKKYAREVTKCDQITTEGNQRGTCEGKRGKDSGDESEN